MSDDDGAYRFIPRLTRAQKRARNRENSARYLKRKRVEDYESRRDAMTPEQRLQRKLTDSPLTRDWYEKVQAWAEDDTSSARGYDNQLLKLAIRGKSLVLMGNLDPDEMWSLLSWAGKRNGYWNNSKFQKTVERGWAYAEQEHNDTTRTNDGYTAIGADDGYTAIGHTARVVDIAVVSLRGDDGVERSEYQSLAEVVSRSSLGAATKRFAYVLVLYGFMLGTDEVTLSLRVMAAPFGWRTDRTVRYHLARLVKVGVFEVDRGRAYRKKLGSIPTTVRFNLDRFPEPVDTPTVNLDSYRELAEGFKPARKARADQVRADRGAWRQENNTSKADEMTSKGEAMRMPPGLTMEEQFKFLTRGIQK